MQILSPKLYKFTNKTIFIEECFFHLIFSPKLISNFHLYKIIIVPTVTSKTFFNLSFSKNSSLKISIVSKNEFFNIIVSSISLKIKIGDNCPFQGLFTTKIFKALNMIIFISVHICQNMRIVFQFIHLSLLFPI